MIKKGEGIKAATGAAFVFRKLNFSNFVPGSVFS